MTANHSRDLRDLLSNLKRRVEDLEANRTLGSRPFVCTSTTHPSAPATGQPIRETDTGLDALWNGSAWEYPPQLISQQTLINPAASIAVLIPAVGFSTLRVVWSGLSNDTGSATYLGVRFNGDTGNNYLWQYHQINTTTTGGANSGGVTDRIRVATMPAASATANYVGAGEFVISNASGSTYKATSGRSTAITSTTTGFSGTYGGMWLSTAAITSLTLLPLGGSLLAGTSVSVYGS